MDIKDVTLEEIEREINARGRHNVLKLLRSLSDKELVEAYKDKKK
jgi:hypothetical protein